MAVAAFRIPGSICATRNALLAGGRSVDAWRSSSPGPIGMAPQSQAEGALTGDFTMLKYVINLSASELERTLGFAAGRLQSGYRLIMLARNESISEEDFDLNASTRWSHGAVGNPDPEEQGTNIEKLLNARGQNVLALKLKVVAFFAKGGGNTPAKILPNLVHKDGMQYPDATALGAGVRSWVPQFTLKKGVRKKAEMVRSE